MPERDKQGNKKEHSGNEQKKARGSVSDALGSQLVRINTRTNDIFDKRGHGAILQKIRT